MSGEMTKACTQAQVKNCEYLHMGTPHIGARWMPMDEKVSEIAICSGYFDNSEDAIAKLQNITASSADFNASQVKYRCEEIKPIGEVTTVTKSAWGRFVELLGF